MSYITAVKIWFWLSVFATAAGWTLSFFGVLRLAGYLVLGAVTIVACLELRNRGLIRLEKSPFRWSWTKWRQRFVRPFPLMFLLLAALALLGGLLYPPSNHTGLSYRIPRVLHWLEAGEWHWIYAPNYRMNTRTCGIEWLSAPVLALFKSDRGLFLLNFIPYLLLPGMLYSMLTRLGVRTRVAWNWMWILPTGYVFLLQAGSLGNDAYPTLYAVAAVDFACRAWTSRRVGDLWHSGLAVALLTGAKASNPPLCLMWLLLLAPLWRMLRDRPIGSSVVFVLMMLVSVVPTMLLNLYYCGSWSGLNIEKAGMDMSNPLVGLWGNPLLLLVNNLIPPVFPIASWWNQNSVGLLPGFIGQPLVNNFETGFQYVWEIPTEDWAGIGPGVTVLALVSAGWAIAGWLRRTPAARRALPFPSLVWKLALLAPWIGLAVYCLKSGMVTPGRLIAPYYPLLLPALLVGAEQSNLIRKTWWRGLAWLNFLAAFFVLIVTPPRPLWPAQTILTKLHAAAPEQGLIKRALTTYSTYAVRSDPLAELREHVPADAKIVGMVAGPDDLDISFWRPFGTRRVAHIELHKETHEQIKARQIPYAIVSDLQLQLEQVPLADWLTRTRAEVVTNVIATVTVSAGPQKWYLVRFPAEPTPATKKPW